MELFSYWFMLMALGWGLLSQLLLFYYFSHFSESSKHLLPIEYHINIWPVSSQLSCGDTCQICMWFKESKYFCKIYQHEELMNRASVPPPHLWHSMANDFPEIIAHLGVNTMRWMVYPIELTCLNWKGRGGGIYWHIQTQTKMADILQTTFWSKFSCMKIVVFSFKFYRSLFN